jgi:tRNA-modifying protein YgfZ
VRQNAGYRRSGAGVVDLAGKDRGEFLQGQCTNDVLTLPEGGVLSAAALTPKGKLLHVFRVAALPDRFRLLTAAGRSDSLKAHLQKFAVGRKVELADLSADRVRFDLQGPAPGSLPAAPAGSLLEARFCGEAVEVWPAEGEIAAIWIVPETSAGPVETGLERELPRLTPEESEILRLEAGRPEFGKDMDESHLPDEVGMEEAISRTKGCYVGQEIVARLRTYGHVNRRLVRFSFSAATPPAPGAVLVRPEEPDREAGRVTSAAVSPELGPIGLGYARREIAEGDHLVLRDDPSVTARVFSKL